mmetsp:Transcript_78737/g.218798  ORF Transcript_78737/g.218798 Transcript_78737/m.218798 type:complete len:99 (+) Transcript_78737:1-297(+)
MRRIILDYPMPGLLYWSDDIDPMHVLLTWLGTSLFCRHVPGDPSGDILVWYLTGSDRLRVYASPLNYREDVAIDRFLSAVQASWPHGHSRAAPHGPRW